MAAAYAAVFSYLSLVKLRYYLYTDFDLAIFVQATNSILHGSFASSIAGLNLLGAHSALSLLLVAPFFALVRSPATLLVAQSVALALGAIPIHRLARRRLGSGVAAACFAALYLLHPALGYLNLFEFHSESLAVPALLFAFDYVDQGRLLPSGIAAAVALTGREDAALVVAALGLWALVTRRPRALGAAALLIALAAVSLFLTFGVLQPTYGTGEVEYIALYREWGRSIPEVMTNVAHQPLRALEWMIATPGLAEETALKHQFYPRMLLPLGFLPLLSPWTLAIAVPVVAEHFLTSHINQYMIIYQYTAFVTPILAVAGVLGLANLVKLVTGVRPGQAAPVGRMRVAGGLKRVLPLVALAASVAANLLYGPITGFLEPRPLDRLERFWPDDDDRALRPWRDSLLARVPRRGGVVAGFGYLARLAARDSLHAFHHLVTGHYTASTKPFPVPEGVVALIADDDVETLAPLVDPETGPRLRDLIARNGLVPAGLAGGGMLYLRGPAPPDSVEMWAAGDLPIARPRRIDYDGRLDFLGDEIVAARVPAGGRLPVRTFWRRREPVGRIYILDFVLRDGRGQPVNEASVFLGYSVNPAHLWPAGEAVRMTYPVVVPPTLAPGRYDLAMSLLAWDGRAVAPARADDPGLARAGSLVDLGEVEVGPR